MLLVLIGHADVVDHYRTLWIYKWVYLFHMPLFFCVSGYLFALTESYSLKVSTFVRKKDISIVDTFSRNYNDWIPAKVTNRNSSRTSC